MKLSTLFKDNMVFSANRPIRIFGEGSGSATAEIAGNKAAGEFTAEKWVLELPPLPYGGPYELKVSLNGNENLIKNVMIGKVFIASGQSNMELLLQQTDYLPEKYETQENVRFFLIAPILSDPEISQWTLCQREEVAHVSALAYHFSLSLYKKHRVPIGVICCYQGASVIESWMSAEDNADPRFALDVSEKECCHTVKDYEKWNKPTYLYENAFYLIPPLAVDGVIWYQGESDSTVAEGNIYAEELEAMVKCWRKDLGDMDLPFHVIQIADFDGRKDEGWRSIQNAQVKACEIIPNSSLIKCRDICSSWNIHPPEKEELGKRTAESIDSFWQ